MSWEDKETTGYLVDADTGDRLAFQYNPDDIVDEKSTAYAMIKIPGMSHPRYQYVAGEARKITFKLVFFKGSVKESVAWLRSLLYPEHSGTMLKNAPHKVIFMFGDLYSGVTCVVRQVKARYFHMFEGQSLLPMRAEVDVVLEEYVDQSVNYSEVR
jgi:hypothetical protein